MSNKTKTVSIVIPAFNEEEVLEDLYSEIKKLLNGAGPEYEIIFIDDGSTDNSFAVLKEIAKEDSRVKIIRFRKNFGQTAAIAAGFNAAGGEILVTMDSDLQNDPKDVPKLIDKIEEGFDVVSGWRKDRKDPFLLRRLPSIIANKLISLITGVYLKDYGCTLKAYRKDVIQSLNLYGEMHRFIPAIAAWSGIKLAEIPVNHFPRKKGKSKYGPNRTFKVLMDIIKIKFLGSFSSKPMYVFGAMGSIFMVLAAICFFITAYRALILGRGQASPVLSMMVIFFLGALQFFLMGLLAELMIQLHYEANHKRPYHIREKVNC